MCYELKNKITTAIKNKALCQHLLNWLKIEFKLDSLPNTPSKITPEVVAKKIQDCLEIEKDLSQATEIESLLQIIDNIIVKLSEIFSGRLDRKEYKSNYTEIKDNIVNIIKYPESFLLSSDKCECLELIDKLFLKIQQNNEKDCLNIFNLNTEILNTIINYKKSKNDDLITNNSTATKSKNIFLKNPASTFKREWNTSRVTNFFREIKTDGICEKNEEHDTAKLKDLNQAKEQLLLIKEKLNVWNLLITDYTQQPINEIDTVLIDLEPRSESLSVHNLNIDEKFNELIRKILCQFEAVNACISKKGYWLANSVVNKPSFAKKLLQLGYFDIDFSEKKIKAKLGDTISFDEINNLILEKNFWTLLFTYRIVRWPWMNKAIFASTWAQQLCLPDIITRTVELREKLSTNNNEALVKKIIVLLNVFSPYKKSEDVVKILKEVKVYIVAQSNQLETLELKINNCSNEKINLAETPANRNPANFFVGCDSLSATDYRFNPFPPILVN